LTHDPITTLIGGGLGFIVTITSIVGIVPIVGPYLYQIIVKGIYQILDLQLTLVYWFGFILSCLFTLGSIITLILLILDRLDKI